MTARAQFPDEQSADGAFERQEDAFRAWVSNDGSTPYPAVAGRYHLYVSLACPWAHRTVIARMLCGLEGAIGLTVVDPVRDDRGWAFREGPGFSTDPVNGFAFLSQAYEASQPRYRGRVTVPVLWDKETRRIVNNSEDDLCRMFCGAFAGLGRHRAELFPPGIEAEHAELALYIYENVNNGVYEAGFATSQVAYEKACRRVFAALDALEGRLGPAGYLFGPRIVDYPHLQGYLLNLYQHPGVAETVNFDHIKRHYYYTHDDINPTRVVPLGPVLDFIKPSGRP